MLATLSHNKSWQCLLFIALLGIFSIPVEATVPDTIDYQGYLTDSSGSPVNGTINITFHLYNVDTGGVAMWSDTQAVPLSNGLFNVKLGGPGSPFPVGLFDAPLFLAIDVAGDGEMTPRIAMSSAGFAHKADDALTLQGQSAASLDQSAHVTSTSNPHVVTAAQVGAVSSINFTLHSSDPNAHHSKTSSFSELIDQATDAQLPAVIARDSEIIPTVLSGDGSGSTLDADLLDGLNSTAFMSAGTDNWVNTTGDTMSGDLNILANVGIGTTTPAYYLDVRGGLANYLGYFNNDNNTSGNAFGIYAEADAFNTGTGNGYGGTFYGIGGNTGGNAYGTRNYAYAYGSANAYGVYSISTGGSTTGNEYAFYGIGDTYISGDVGVGIISPGYKLDVRGGVGDYLAYFYNDNSGSGDTYGLYARGDAYDTDTGLGQGGRFVGFGGSTSGAAFGSSHYAYAYGTSPAYGVYSEAIGGSTTGREYAFWGWGDVFFSGNVGLGTAVPNVKLEIVDSQVSNIIARFDNTSTNINADGITIQIGPDNNPTTNNQFIRLQDGNGSLVGYVNGNNLGGVNFASVSDARLKTNIIDFAGGLDMVSHMKVRHYEFIEAPGSKQIGFLAQELQAVFPQAVSGSPGDKLEESPMAVDYGRLTPVLVSAIQELIEKNKALERDNERLEKEIDEIKNTLGL